MLPFISPLAQGTPDHPLPKERIVDRIIKAERQHIDFCYCTMGKIVSDHRAAGSAYIHSAPPLARSLALSLSLAPVTLSYCGKHCLQTITGIHVDEREQEVDDPVHYLVTGTYRPFCYLGYEADIPPCCPPLDGLHYNNTGRRVRDALSVVHLQNIVVSSRQ